MTPGRVLIVERMVLLAGFVAMVTAAVAVEWRAGLFLAGLFLAGSALDLRRRP